MALDAHDAEDHGVDAVQAIAEDRRHALRQAGSDPALLGLQDIPFNDDQILGQAARLSDAGDRQRKRNQQEEGEDQDPDAKHAETEGEQVVAEILKRQMDHVCGAGGVIRPLVSSITCVARDSSRGLWVAITKVAPRS